MEERYNPMKSAEIATEHNYNMLDGVLNNQAPPPEEKELDKVMKPLIRYRLFYSVIPVLLQKAGKSTCSAVF